MRNAGVDAEEKQPHQQQGDNDACRPVHERGDETDGRQVVKEQIAVDREGTAKDDDDRSTEDDGDIIDQPFLQGPLFRDTPDVVEYAFDIHEKTDHTPEHDSDAGDDKHPGMNILDIGLRETHDGVVNLRLS